MCELRQPRPGRRDGGVPARAGNGRPVSKLPQRADGFRHRAGDDVRRPARPRRARASVSHSQRLTLVAAIVGSGVAAIDGSIVNVALPAIERDLGGGLPAQQWVSNAYLLALGSLILVGGSLGDIYGERRIFALGVAAFGLFSVACALAPTIDVLIVARAFQGAAGALLTPSSLAIIVGAFSPKERGAAIGTWT